MERTCARDDECAVARIEISGSRPCCGACATTPGTRRWHAKLQRHCAAHPPADCPPLACPMGPTRAVCRAGRCEATANGEDGGPAFVMDDRRCLPAMVCDDWKGCAHVAGNGQDGWFVTDADRVARGEIASVQDNVCTSGARCRAAKIALPDVVCAPWSIPPLIGPPPYACTPDARTVPAVDAVIARHERERRADALLRARLGIAEETKRIVARLTDERRMPACRRPND